MQEAARSRGILGPMRGADHDPSLSDESLLARARAGDPEAFDRLVARHLDRVWRVVWKIVRHQEDAEDVVQEVFLAAWQGLAGFRGEAQISTWLHSIAVTRSLNHLDRAAERLRRASEPLERPVAGDDSRLAARAEVERGIAGGAGSPLEHLEAKELRRRLAECLQRLPAAWRAILALRDGEERSYEEIARVLAVRLGTVRSRLARARISLKECIEGQAS